MLFSSLNVEELQLPKERYAGYVRSEELKTVNSAHIATVVHDRIADGKLLHLNMDETTLAQKKLGGTAISNMLMNCLMELLRQQLKTFPRTWKG